MKNKLFKKKFNQKNLFEKKVHQKAGGKVPYGNNKKKKLRAGFFSFTGCEGCQLTVLEALQEHPELLKLFSVEYNKLLKDCKLKGTYGVAFVEGSISNKETLKKAQEVRKKSRYLVALGSCATNTCVNGFRMRVPAEVRKQIERERGGKKDFGVFPLKKFVEVDFELRACPPIKEELIEFISDFYSGIKPIERDFPVCKECKENENDCVFLRGIPCLGPITRGGCNSVCVNEGAQCFGCRGLSREANLPRFRELLKEIGLSKTEVNELLNEFSAEMGLKKGERNRVRQGGGKGG